MIQITPFTCITCVNLFLTYDASKNDTRDDSIPSEYIILYCSPIPWRLISTILTHLGFKVVSFRTAVFIKRCTFWQSAIGEYLHFLKFQGGFDAPNIYNTYIINTYKRIDKNFKTLAYSFYPFTFNYQEISRPSNATINMAARFTWIPDG